MLNKTSFTVLFLAYVKFLEGFTQHFWLPVRLPSWSSWKAKEFHFPYVLLELFLVLLSKC